ncbi:NAD-dependent epimerase/dehydratase family protein [Candidatus Omnitrophota bacterium]
MIDIKKKRIALIGGAGFIGHNLALELAERGAEVLVVDSLFVNNLMSFAPIKKQFEHQDLYYHIIHQRLKLLRNAHISVEPIDARKYHKLSHALDVFNPSIMVHLAAVAHANLSNKDPHSTFDHSFRTLENSLDYSRGSRIEHFIFFSSSMIYGNFPSETVTEETPCEPIGIYGALKFGSEKMVIAYHNVFDLPYTIIRPSALYGERCVSRRVGQIFIENAFEGKEISISGDGSNRLDFTYIEDLTRGIVNVIEHEGSKKQIFNLTYGKSHSIAEMADIIKEHFPKAAIKYTPKDKLTPTRGTLSVDKARSMIGYDPQYPLRKGFVKYINWYKDLYAGFHADKK